MQNHIRKLTRLPYGIVEAGRQWLCAVEHWMTNDYEMQRIDTVDQLFHKRGDNGDIVLFAAKFVDDFHIAGVIRTIDQFFKALDEAFTLRKVERGHEPKFLGCTIKRQNNDAITLTIPEYMERIKELDIGKGRRQELLAPANSADTHEYRSFAGTLLYFGQAVLPQASFIASKLQQ